MLLFKNYMKVGARNLIKHRLTSTINIKGIALAVACCIVAYLYVAYSLTMDHFHTAKEKFFMVNSIGSPGQGEETRGLVPYLLGSQVLKEIPEVEAHVTLVKGHAQVKRNDQVFHEVILYTNPSFFEAFTFGLLYGGQITAINWEQEGVVISHETARKYFGEKKPLGELLELTLNP
jgi:hypothetical protein